jgi:hypothetical protein
LEMPKYSHYQPFMSNWNEIFYGVLTPAFDPMWLGTKTPDQVIPAVVKSINEKYFSKK